MWNLFIGYDFMFRKQLLIISIVIENVALAYYYYYSVFFKLLKIKICLLLMASFAWSSGPQPTPHCDSRLIASPSYFFFQLAGKIVWIMYFLNAIGLRNNLTSSRNVFSYLLTAKKKQISHININTIWSNPFKNIVSCISRVTCHNLTSRVCLRFVNKHCVCASARMCGKVCEGLP